MNPFNQRTEVGKKESRTKVQETGRLTKQEQVQKVLGNCCEQSGSIYGLS